MSVVEPITAANSTTGAGVIDSWHSVATAADELKTAHDGDRAAIGVELGIATASAALDTVAFAIDPLAKLIAAGLGWMIEHISFLRWPLDQIAGDPDQIKLVADQLHRIGEDLRNAAADLDTALEAQITHWQGPGYDSFRTEITGHRTHIDDAGHSVDIAGYVVETTMALIAAVRALFRDVITTLLGDIISTMLVALALAAVTFGASIPVAVVKCVAEGTIEGTELALKLAKVSAFAGRVAARLKELAGLTKGERPTTPQTAGSTHELDSMSTPHSPLSTPPSTSRPPTPDERPPSSQSNDTPGEEDPFETWLLADAHFNGPHGRTPHDSLPGTPHEETPPTTPPTPPHEETPHDSTETSGSHTGAPDSAGTQGPQSLLQPKAIEKLTKKYEDWLKTNFAGANAKVKFFDQWVKNNAPDAYPMIKALADAKSAKNWVGWVGKDIVNVDKQLTDIESRAEAAWQESDEKWREDHPDPSAT